MRGVVAAFPYQTHTVLTDNRAAFTQNASTKWDSMRHVFDRVRDEHGIEHRLTKPCHPWTNGQAERMNRTVKDAMVKAFHYETTQALCAHVPLQDICDAWETDPAPFKINPHHLTTGLYNYFQAGTAFPQMPMPGSKVREVISFINDSGFGAIGTPDMCTAQIERLQVQSNGGFGAYLMLAHNWANPQATLRSYELVARHVMPRFQGQEQATPAAAQRAQGARPALAEVHAKAMETATQRYAAELASG